LALTLCVAATAAGGRVYAGDPPAQNAQVSATAEALFSEGRALLKEKKYAEACPKLAESLRIDPAVGTMLYLADCYEKNGQIASAWAMFSDAVSAAHNAGQSDRELKAKLRVQALGPKLVKLSLSPAPDNKATEGLELKRDGLVLGSALFGTAVPVDPGDHKIEVSAPGKKPWSGTVTVPSKAGTVIAFEVPRLEDLPPPPPPEPTVTAVATTPPPPTASAPPPTPTVTATATVVAPPPLPTAAPDTGSTRTIGFVVGAVGVVGLGVAGGLGLTAKSKNDEALSKYCTATTCADQKGIDLTNDAKSLATGSTVGFILGGVATAAGVALILYPSLSHPTAAPASAKAASAHLVVGPGSLSVRGRF
jgi:serine/threonine-protein kinase